MRDIMSTCVAPVKLYSELRSAHREHIVVLFVEQKKLFFDIVDKVLSLYLYPI